jgi:undecaprenyl-diphosphatase
MNELLRWDKELLLWLNSFHTPWLDPVMLTITKTIFWIPLYLFLVYLIFKNFRQEGWLILAGAGLSILLADQITASFMKPFFARLRPSQEPGLQGLVHLVDGYKGGLYGFASSHAANTFAVAFMIWFVFRKIYSWIGFIFLWAVVMTYTRIYLGVHYPGDILAGMLVGILSAWAGFRFYRWLKFLKGRRDEVKGTR